MVVIAYVSRTAETVMELKTLKARIVGLGRFSVLICIQCFSGSGFVRADQMSGKGRAAADVPDQAAACSALLILVRVPLARPRNGVKECLQFRQPFRWNPRTNELQVVYILFAQ